MPSKKKKYNARFPPARIKKIMQKDEDVGKVAAPVPVLISKALEIFVESLITKSSQQTLSRNAKTLTTSHIKQCIELESKFDFLKDLVENVPTISCEDEDTNNSGSHHAESRHSNARFPSSRKKHSMARDVSAQSSVQSVDEPSTEEDSDDSEDSHEKNNSKRHPADRRSASTSSLQEPSYSVPRHNHSFPQQPSGTAFPPAMPSLPLEHALSGNTPAMGVYIAPHTQTRNNDDDDDSDEDYDA